MIVVENLTKKYGDVTAVNDISFTVQPGIVTGFLGPNGAGKSTTMRMILGLDKPTSGRALVNGHEYRKSAAPIAELGALLEAKSVDKGRSARNHLRALGATVGIGKQRVDDLLELVGLADVANKSAGSFSLGMGQRLGIATALLADPKVVMLDEPVNGLDPDGILWIRNLLKELAEQGRTVFLSSHLMSEMEMTAEHLIVIGRGKIISDTSMAEFIAAAGAAGVRVSSPRIVDLQQSLRSNRAEFEVTDTNTLLVQSLSAAEIGELAAQNGIPLHELTPLAPSLEEAFMKLTKDSVEFHGGTNV
ncbi:MAG: hypothetical protein RL038_369 [Actinomycetota bacterium]